MKIAVSAAGTTLDTLVDPRFGRCQYFIYADPETLQFEAVDNSNAAVGGGAGISAAQAIAAKGVEAVLTGNCGPNAYQVLSAAGIKVITGVAGRVKDAIQDYTAGKYQVSSQPNVAGHFGQGRGMGGGRGMGYGRGAGRR
jgi:predicted Fe-Mo cluster-binding NifX family protein